MCVTFGHRSVEGDWIHPLRFGQNCLGFFGKHKLYEGFCTGFIRGVLRKSEPFDLGDMSVVENEGFVSVSFVIAYMIGFA